MKYTLLALALIAWPGPPPLTITHLTGDCYVYTTYRPVGGEPYPANSMFLVTGKGVVMFDVPWDTTQYQPLFDSISTRFHQPVVLCISTHFHDDRTAGLSFLKQRGIPTWSSALTRELCVLHHNDVAENVFTKDTTFTVGNYSFSTFYPGAGHTTDNIVIWVPKARVLYGGCFVKSTEAPGLGNLADADPVAWPVSLQRLMKAFPDPDFVIPGHLGWTDKESLRHTARLLQAYKGGQ
ncbi:subclass B1 metallo-beta-lactamase [Dinghuibacter silviterrae]|uniref:beta-lactamase n=1 Tax=Dinghuibacter silviterrae TaxID=1539049 RepID=A0A4R8DH58_9BACT|nr:subclass B1 metallo-beta-lactamase [Dinghuibacter silviterrae]TDW97039.1 metallo-beta-lactamase class B [Dinghuibacter silviterrae]